MTQEADSARAARVLIVDDQACIAGAVACLLAEARAAEVRVAACGEQALSVAEQWRPELVLVDVQMPGMPPLALCQQLRRVAGLAEVPIYLFTGLLPDNVELSPLLTVVQGVINKPPDPTEVFAVLDAVVSRRECP
ncbi:MAG: response regulator [Armatimonadetes bacterium]|nr:response regulator [Armatimonadota bacterium]